MPLDDNSSYLSTVCFRKSGSVCQDWFKYTITARHGPNWRVPSTVVSRLTFKHGFPFPNAQEVQLHLRKLLFPSPVAFLSQQILKVTHVDLPAQVVSHENGKLSLWGALVFKSHASCQQHIKFFNSSNSSKYGNCFLLDQRLINTSIAVKTFLRLRVIITASSSNPPSSVLTSMPQVLMFEHCLFQSLGISFHGIHQIGAPSSFPVNGLVINAGTGQSRAPSSTRGGIGASLSHSRGSRQCVVKVVKDFCAITLA
ncbi:hypothetical protein WG66_002242 [Moniliophthora roreri]|nr:hypothetical protein WG66_002242 [Moniliophthora roreri]